MKKYITKIINCKKKHYYDSIDNKQKKIKTEEYKKDKLFRIYKYKYDLLGRKIGTEIFDSNNKLIEKKIT